MASGNLDEDARPVSAAAPGAGSSGPRVYVAGDTRVKLYRYSKTATLFASWVCLGLYNEVIGPTLPDLKQRIGCNYEEIARVLSARSAGLFIGSILGGLVHDRWPYRRDLFIGLALIVSAVTIGVAPWCRSLWQLALVFHLMGHSHGFLTTGGNPLLAFLWAERSAGPYNLLHSGFGFGATIAPLISRPFLSGSRDSSLNSSSSAGASANTLSLPINDTGLYNSTQSVPTTASDPVLSLSHIEYPYGIVAALCAAISIVFIVYQLSPTPPQFAIAPTPAGTTWKSIRVAWKKLTQRSSPSSSSDGGSSSTGSRFFVVRKFLFCLDVSRLFRTSMLALMFLYYMFVVGGERAYGKFVFSFAVDSPSLQLSKSEAAWLTSGYWISFTAARLTAFVAARWVPVRILLYVEVCGTLAAAIGLNVLGHRVVAFWLFTVAFGFFKSPLFPSCLGWANQYIEISSSVIAVVNVGSSSGGMLVQWLTGYAFQYHGPASFLYIAAAYSVAIFLLYVLMDRVAVRHGGRYDDLANASRSTSEDAATAAAAGEASLAAPGDDADGGRGGGGSHWLNACCRRCFNSSGGRKVGPAVVERREVEAGQVDQQVLKDESLAVHEAFNKHQAPNISFVFPMDDRSLTLKKH